MAVFSFTSLGVLFGGALLISAVDIDQHVDFLRRNFDLTDARTYRTDENWGMTCFFVDMDSDGVDEIISSTVSQSDRSGSVWSFWSIKPDGKLYPVGVERMLSSDFSFYCNDDSYYRMCVGAGRRYVVAGLDMFAGITGDDHILRSSTSPDCVFGIDKDGQLSVKKIEPSLDAVFFSCTNAHAVRLYSESYSGFNFKFEPWSRCVDWFGYPHPKPVPVPEAPDGFGAFAAAYKKEAQMRAGATNDVPAHAVFLDADNDGSTDCYMTSEADRVEADTYRWTLYRNVSGKLAKAKEAVRPVAGRDDLPLLNPRALARKDAFCRIIRFDAPPTYVVLDAAKVEKGTVKKTITHRWTHSIEKLPCKTY